MTEKTCACGCGEQVAESATYIRGHHWRVKRERAGLPESKVCEQCGRTYSREEIRGRQPASHWQARRYCSHECVVAARQPDLTNPLKRCPVCGEEKDRMAEFTKQRNTADGRAALCRMCANARRRKRTPEENRESNLRNFYGITLAEYDAMLEAQGGVCAICRQPETAKRGEKVFALAVDHCHETKKIRGLLCGNCNKGIGGLRHDPALLEAAMRYLRETA